MSGGNPLVADSVDTATAFSGAMLLEDGEQLVTAIQSGDWISGGMAVFSGALDTAATVSDPIGSLIAAGLGWLMDHLEPLKGWLNDLTGDAGEVQGFATTWGNVAEHLTGVGQELSARLSDVADMRGEAISAYLALQTDIAKHVHAAGQWAAGMKTGMEIASMIVQAVHDIVRDTLAQLVGSIISWAGELLLTAGLATPLVIEQVSTRVASLTGRVSKFITTLVDAVTKLSKHLDKLKDLFRRLADLFKKADGSGRNAGGDGFVHDAPARPGRTYSLTDGTSYTTRWAPEQLDGPGANDQLMRAITQSGHTRDEIVDLIHKPTADLTPAEATLLHDLRSQITLTSDTPMQRVIPPNEAAARIGGTYAYAPESTGGFVTRLQDAAHMATSQDVVNGLRLDYSGSEFRTTLQSPVHADNPIQLIRYTTDAAAEVPFNSTVAGHPTLHNDPPPFTGNGFTGSGRPESGAYTPDGNIVPEFKTPNGTIMNGSSEMWEVTGSGTYRLLAVLRGGVWQAVR